MTHDELLASIEFNKQTLESSDRNSNALRAVVELHKPKLRITYEGEKEYICTCSTPVFIYYPCPTIQAIEKELK